MDNLQKEILIGSLLGDGWLGANSSFNWSFYKKQKLTNKEYLVWHFNMFGNLSCSLNDRKQELKFDYYLKKNQKFISEYCLFSTHTNDSFSKEGHRWYLNNQGIFKRNKYGQKIKIIPNDIVLTPCALAVWFCDDGTNCIKSRQAILYTNCFTEEECEFLKEKIYKEFRIKSSINHNRSKPVIRVSCSDYLNFVEIIKPYVVWNCFQYKINCRLPKFGEKHWKSKLSNANIEEIKLMYSKGIKQIHLAEKFGVSPTCICNILNGKRRK